MSGLTGAVGLLARLLRAKTTGQGLRCRDLPVRRRHAPAHPSRHVVSQRGRRLAARAAQRAPVVGAGPDLPDRGRLDLHHMHDPEILAVAGEGDGSQRSAGGSALRRSQQPRRASRPLTDALDPHISHAHHRRLAGGLQRIASAARSTGSTRRSTKRLHALGPVWSAAVPHPAKGSLRVIANPCASTASGRRQAACAPLGADNNSLLGKPHEARRSEGRRPVLVPAGPYHDGAGRSRRRGDQGRAWPRRPWRHIRPPMSAPRCSSATWARQEERRARPQERAGSRRSLSPGLLQPTLVESFRPGVAAPLRRRLRGGGRRRIPASSTARSAPSARTAYPGAPRTTSRSRR